MSDHIDTGVALVHSYLCWLRDTRGMTWREMGAYLGINFESLRAINARQGQGTTRILRQIEASIPEGWTNGEEQSERSGERHLGRQGTPVR